MDRRERQEYLSQRRWRDPELVGVDRNPATSGSPAGQFQAGVSNLQLIGTKCSYRPDCKPGFNRYTIAARSSNSSHESSSTSEVSNRVFVVYGHDLVACEQLELILHRLDLEPFVLGNTSGSGLTIIEALEREIMSPTEGERFGIVLLTPDDMAYSRGDDPANTEPRARQNVVMEMGMLIAAFGRSRVAILRKGHVAVPSDANGIIYLAFNDHVKEAAPRLCQRLGEAGFELDPDLIARASS